MRLADIAQMVAQYGARRYLEKQAGLGVALPTAFGYGLSLPAQMKGMEKTYRDSRGGLDQAALEQLAPEVATNFKHAGFTDFLQGLSGMKPEKTPYRVTDPASGLVSSGTDITPPPQDAMLGGILGPIMGSAGMPILTAPGKALGTRIERSLSGREFGERQDPARMLGQATINSLGKGMGQIGADLLKDMATKAVSATRKLRNDSARTAIIDQLKHEDMILREADDQELMEAYHTMTRFAPVLSTDKNAVRSFLRQAVMSGTGPDYVTIKLLVDSERAITGYKPGSKRVPWT